MFGTPNAREAIAQLAILRWLAVGGQSVAILVGGYLLNFSIPVVILMLGPLALTLFNLTVQVRLRRYPGPVKPAEVLLNLAADVVVACMRKRTQIRLVLARGLRARALQAGAGPRAVAGTASGAARELRARLRAGAGAAGSFPEFSIGLASAVPAAALAAARRGDGGNVATAEAAAADGPALEPGLLHPGAAEAGL
jgi:hypothetical protein